MRRKIIVMLLAATLAAALVIGLTGAWFTVPDQTLGRAYVAGGNVGLAVTSTGSFNVSSLEPGGPYQTLGFVHVVNNGSLDLKWRMGLGNISDPNGIAGKLEVKGTLNPSDAPAWGSIGPHDSMVWDTWASQLAGWNNIAVWESPTAYAFTAGADSWYKIEVKLDATADNSMQNATYAADLVFGATQYSNPSWAQ